MLPEVQQYLKRTAILLFQIMLFLMLVRAFGIEPAFVQGQSMDPTFHDEQRLVVNKFSYLVAAPKRGDIIRFRKEDMPSPVVKRVVALPGEHVHITQNALHITALDGEEFMLEEPYLPEDALTNVGFGMPVEFFVGEHEYFVLGDNRLYSQDSRMYGPVHRRNIQGKVMFTQ